MGLHLGLEFGLVLGHGLGFGSVLGLGPGLCHCLGLGLGLGLGLLDLIVFCQILYCLASSLIRCSLIVSYPV